MSLKRFVAKVMRRVPFLYPLLVRMMNQTAAVFTVGVTGVVFNPKGEVLLLEHVFRDRYPWGLPGGWVRHREQPQDALRRELLEELGLAVQVGTPLLVELDGPPGHLETGFLCQATGEPRCLSREILSASWVSPDALPDDLYWLDREMIRRAQSLRKRSPDEPPDR